MGNRAEKPQGAASRPKKEGEPLPVPAGRRPPSCNIEKRNRATNAKEHKR
jgi:hypothetical protein